VAVTDTITPAYIKTNYLFGIDLTDDSGIAFPESLFTNSINMAVGLIEARLDIVLSGLNDFDERHDVDSGMMESYYLIQLDRRPIRSITAAYVQYGGFDKSKLPDSFTHISSEVGGQIQFIAGPEFYNVAGVGGQPIVVPGFLAGGQYLPLYLRFEYKAGFDGVTYPYPAEILDLISLYSCLLPLDTAGDLIAGAGISSKSISMDGLSTSLNTTSSATNSGYGSRIISYRKRADELLAQLQRKYRVPPLMAI
jgi:hypothetical protein